ncbi:uncharacterized protein EKO05_0002276 [Ascochyta rabiei]|uniref:uncharacterized protein n=1 Tax=Didymella rabiei TaxID=5454 RepID=UPI002209CF90|nr:uncharacterized protein EKO05_0002276 [Ascochyta rabiei]UPX11682.1 hypothetical protein EKO05_0002276 [Ascochyta rabiei]
MKMGFFPALVYVSLLAFLPSVYSQDSVSYDLGTYGTNDSKGTPSQSYMSNTYVKPPQIQVNKDESGLADGYVFLGMDGRPTSGQNWPTIYGNCIDDTTSFAVVLTILTDFSQDRMGTLVWTGNYTEPFDFKTQTYKGQPVLTSCSGELKDGFGRGSYFILNQSYAEIAHFQANRFGDDMGDIHEITITSDNVALIPIYRAIPWNLKEIGCIEDGCLFENTFQEIDIESGEFVFEWNASTHVGINESYNSLPEDVGRAESSPWDYFHINSIEKDANGDHLVSA